MAVLFEIFIPCFFGEKLIHSSDKLSTTLFHSQWPESSKKFKHSLKIFMENSKKPIKITCGKVFDINLKTFMAICNGAYSMFNVLSKVRK